MEDESLCSRSSPFGDDLPDEIILQIFSYLTPIDIYVILFINKKFNRIVSDKHLKQLFIERYITFTRSKGRLRTKRIVGLNINRKFIVKTTNWCPICELNEQCRKMCSICHNYFCGNALFYDEFRSRTLPSRVVGICCLDCVCKNCGTRIENCKGCNKLNYCKICHHEQPYCKECYNERKKLIDVLWLRDISQDTIKTISMLLENKSIL